MSDTLCLGGIRELDINCVTTQLSWEVGTGDGDVVITKDIQVLSWSDGGESILNNILVQPLFNRDDTMTAYHLWLP